MQGHAVFCIWEAFSVCIHPDLPTAGFGHQVFEISANSLGFLFSTDPIALTVEAPHIIAFVVVVIDKSGYEESGRFSPEVIFVFETIEGTGDATASVVIHQVSADDIMIVAQSIGETRTSGIQQQESRTECCGVDENDLCLVFVGLSGVCINDLNPDRFSGFFIKKDAVCQCVGANGEISGRLCRRQGG